MDKHEPLAEQHSALWTRLRPSAVAPVVLIPVLFVLTGLAIPGYIGKNSVLSVLVIAALLGIASLGQTWAVLLGGIDLSIPAVIGMADVLSTRLYGDGWPLWRAYGLVIVLAIGIGLVNGVATQLLRAHSLLITFATGSIVLGAVLATTGSQTIGTVPTWMTNAVSPIGKTGPIPVPAAIILWLLLAILAVGAQRWTRFGKNMYATGSSPIAARLALVRTTVVWGVVFACSSLFAAVAGILLTGFTGAADPGVGQPYLFLTLAAVVVGGTSMLGGVGGYGRTVVGSLIITELTTLLIGLGYAQELQQMVLGLVIVFLAAVYGRQAHVRYRT